MMRRRALTVSPPNQSKRALRPSRAAARKFPFASSKSMCPVTSPYSPEIPMTSPIQKAALATSSTIVGPEGRTRHSMRRWGFPSVMP